MVEILRAGGEVIGYVVLVTETRTVVKVGSGDASPTTVTTKPSVGKQGEEMEGNLSVTCLSCDPLCCRWRSPACS